MLPFHDAPTVGHGAIPPASFANAAQLRLRLPLGSSILTLQESRAPHASTSAHCCTMDPFNLVTMSYPAPPACVTAPLAMALRWMQLQFHPCRGMRAIASMRLTPLVALVLALPLGYTAENARGFDVFRWGKRKKGYGFLSYYCHIPVRHCLT